MTPRRTPSCCLLGIIVMASLAIGVQGARAQSLCTALQYKTAAKYYKWNTTCRARALRNGEAIDGSCLARAEERFDALWAGIEANAECAATGRGGEVRARVLAAIDDLRPILEVSTSGVTCCQAMGVCSMATDPARCPTLAGYVPAAQGDVCDGATGQCKPSPATSGPCCETNFGFCAAGPVTDPLFCPGTLRFGVCQADGSCLAEP